MRNPRAASRYAKALITLGDERNELDTLQKDFEMITQTLSQNTELRAAINSPVIKPDVKSRILVKVFEGNVSKTTVSFLKMLTRHHRSLLLQEIAQHYKEQYLAHKNMVQATVTSAQPLDEDTLAKIVELAEGISNKKVDLVQKQNPELIGGFVLRVGDKQLNTSVLEGLNSIRKNLEKNQYVAAI